MSRIAQRVHGLRVLGYHCAELAVVAAAFFAAYWLRAQTGTWFGQTIGSREAYLWLLPVALVLWSGMLWGFRSYVGFRNRGLLLHLFLVGVICALALVSLYAVLSVFKQYHFNRSLVARISAVSVLRAKCELGSPGITLPITFPP